MPEVPLWKIKIDGQEYPPPQEGDETETQPVTPLEEEFPYVEPEIQSWYEAKKKEYAEFLKTHDSSLLESSTNAFLADPSKRDFIPSLRRLRGPGAWQVLRTFFDRCKDSTLTDQVAAELWKPAVEWILHEKHRKITMIELSDIWRYFEELERKPPEGSPDEEPQVEPEFDENYRFIGEGDE
jgi:hypothetical protein